LILFNHFSERLVDRSGTRLGDQSARWEGKITRASTRDAKRANVITFGSTERNFPMVPPMSNMGRKAAMVVRMVATTGAIT
jgi:hypothetical protein